MISNTARASLFCGLVFMTGIAEAATSQPKGTVPVAERTQTGKTVEAKYTELLTSLKADIEKQLPAIDLAKVAAWMAAITAEEGPAKEAAVTAATVEKMRSAPQVLKDLEEQLKFAPKTLADAQEQLLRARAQGVEDPEKAKQLASAESFLARREKEQKQLLDKIEKAKAAVKDAEANLPKAIQAAEAAKQALNNARTATWKAMDALGMSGILSSDKLDGKLAQFMVLTDATPKGLAEFAQMSPEHEKLVQQLLDNKELMIQMLVADGPNGGKYGEAMKIYTDIQKASPKAKEGFFQRLALAVSLGHAVPILKRNGPTSDLVKVTEEMAKDPSFFIDPVQRYLSYEKWYLAGELQPAFKDLSVWNLALAVDSPDPDEILAWAREMLRTLRPDCIPADSNTSVYVDVVDKEIKYGSDEVKNDRPENACMQNILANGGICGRRGFFGRFMLQAFGVPAVERVEPGHSTLAHWHPDGWKTRLGGNFGKSSFGYYSKIAGRPKFYGADVNFVAMSQAHEDAAAFMRVRRAQWIGALAGEARKPGLITYSGKTRGPTPPKKGEIEKPIFWNDLALEEQRRIIAGMESGRKKSPAIASVAGKAPAATGKITVDDKGVIAIPSAACSSPTESTKSLYHGGYTDQIAFVKDNKSGETRLHLSRYSKASDSFEYTFDAPKAGKYTLVASVVTPKWDQRVFVTANGGTPVEMALPYTIGLWGKSAPVAIELKAGRNVLKFHGPARVTFGTFTLTPMK
ncbi:MAG: hypothetical protein WCJ02_08145 [bacterium]